MTSLKNNVNTKAGHPRIDIVMKSLLPQKINTTDKTVTKTMLFPSINIMKSLKTLDMRVGKKTFYHASGDQTDASILTKQVQKKKQMPNVTRYKGFTKHESTPQA